MKHLDEFRDTALMRSLADRLAAEVKRPWTLMEICGGQTHAILRFGLDQLFPPGLELIHGPGCPVCVTPVEQIDRAIALARRENVTLCSFGDMLRVPGTDGSLLSARAEGADVRVVYSPLDAVRLASAQPGRETVFFAVGFETTAPASAIAVRQAAALGLRNFSILSAHVLVPPAMTSLLDAPGNRVQGFLAAGHVCTIMGRREYDPIARSRRVPIVITGFEPLDLLEGIRRCVRQLEHGECTVENAYGRVVREDGNPEARALVDSVFTPVDRAWRGLGIIPGSGLALVPAYDAFDAEHRFPLPPAAHPETARGVMALRGTPDCRAGEVLQGRLRPNDCPHFGTRCTPDHPLGAPMVSSEGACAAYHRHRTPVAG